MQGLHLSLCILLHILEAGTWYRIGKNQFKPTVGNRELHIKLYFVLKHNIAK
jgi:hypothetical protein